MLDLVALEHQMTQSGASQLCIYKVVRLRLVMLRFKTIFCTGPVLCGYSMGRPQMLGQLVCAQSAETIQPKVGWDGFPSHKGYLAIDSQPPMVLPPTSAHQPKQSNRPNHTEPTNSIQPNNQQSDG